MANCLIERVMEFKAGDTFNILKVTQRGAEIKKAHVLAIVDSDRVVYKWWARFAKSWRYEIEQAVILEIYIERANRRIQPPVSAADAEHDAELRG